MTVIVYRRDVVTMPPEKFTDYSPETFALTNLSTGIHCLQFKQDWMTTFISENGATILGMPIKKLIENPKLWIGRVHPTDVDAVRGALQSTTELTEKHISYRFRDSNNRYRWIGLRCKRKDSETIVGVFSDITRQRILEYTDRIHFAGRNSLKALLDSSDLSNSINTFLELLGTAMLVNRAKLVRFRKDGRAFITHEWVRNNADQTPELPIQLQSETAEWWKTQMDSFGIVSISNTRDAPLPDAIQSDLQECGVGAAIAIPAKINKLIEGFVCFETLSDRAWMPLEMDEVKFVLDGYASSVERRIEDRKQIAEEYNLRRSEERYRLLTAHSPVILFGIDAEGTFTLSEGLGLESMGAGAGEVVGKSVYHVYRNYPIILEQVNSALSGIESHVLSHIGDQCFELWFTPVCDDDGEVLGLSGVAVDITRRNKLEQQQTIMMSELDHRVKNNISAVISLVGLSKQGSHTIDEFVQTLDGRLHALAVAHSTLAKSHWNGAWMRDILSLTLQPYMVGHVNRIQFKGPDIELPGTLARPMCMVIHELATNAAKYGSLSSTEGSVLITTEKNASNLSAKISWVETDGPPLSDEIETGTGTSLLKGLVEHEMHGQITMNYSKDGLICQIEIPLDSKT